MPQAARCLSLLRERDVVLGLVSNAQFFTPELFPALFDEDARSLGFDPELEVYSYREGRAKPDPGLLAKAVDVLDRRGLERDRVLMVGNDRLKDVLPADRAGLRTALFAGDARSYRRSGSARPSPADPDLSAS